jgi:NADH-ubiquinone/plastoquinone oxidoreductase chain 6
VSSIIVVSLVNAVHSVLFLLLVFCIVALLLLSGAEFLSFMILVVYVGAIAVLFLFVVRVHCVQHVPCARQLRQALRAKTVSDFEDACNALSALETDEGIVNDTSDTIGVHAATVPPIPHLPKSRPAYDNRPDAVCEKATPGHVRRESCTSDCERLVARGRQRHAGAVPGGDCGSGRGPILTCRAILLTTKAHHSKGRDWLAHETVRQLMLTHCNLKLLKPNGLVGEGDLDFLKSAIVVAVTCDESGSSTRAATQTA